MLTEADMIPHDTVDIVEGISIAILVISYPSFGEVLELSASQRIP